MIKGTPLRSNIEVFYEHYDELLKDVYPQPADPGHTAWAIDVIDKMLPDDVVNVLDVGCGDGFCEFQFEKRNVQWIGLSANRKEAEKDEIFWSDMGATAFEPESFSLIFARHTLEHSPFPLIALMEWYRISKKYALIVVPAPEYWKVGGLNHYSVLYPEQWQFLFERSNWKVLEENIFKTSDPLFLEYYMVGKKPQDRVWQGEHKDVEYRYLLEKITGGEDG